MRWTGRNGDSGAEDGVVGCLPSSSKGLAVMRSATGHQVPHDTQYGGGPGILNHTVSLKLFWVTKTSVFKKRRTREMTSG